MKLCHHCRLVKGDDSFPRYDVRIRPYCSACLAEIAAEGRAVRDRRQTVARENVVDHRGGLTQALAYVLDQMKPLT